MHLHAYVCNVLDTYLGEGPLVVERKRLAIYTSCAEVPTKMLCIIFPHVQL